MVASPYNCKGTATVLLYCVLCTVVLCCWGDVDSAFPFTTSFLAPKKDHNGSLTSQAKTLKYLIRIRTTHIAKIIHNNFFQNKSTMLLPLFLFILFFIFLRFCIQAIGYIKNKVLQKCPLLNQAISTQNIRSFTMDNKIPYILSYQRCFSCRFYLLLVLNGTRHIKVNLKRKKEILFQER